MVRVTDEQRAANRAATARSPVGPLAARAVQQIRQPVGLKRKVKKKTPGVARSSRTDSDMRLSVRSPYYVLPEKLGRINASRKKTRNKWSNDPCVERPDHKKAANYKRKGVGSGSYAPRRWC